MPYQKPLSEFYLSATDEALTEHIRKVRQELGKETVILAHHYQRPEIVAFGDQRGDSLKLAQFAAAQEAARYVVYCGVHFMAESADILKRGNQQVILPDMGAGCDMADMADADDVAMAWQQVTQAVGHADIMPVTYINSTAALKAFVGEHGGIVCTSSNADKIVKWALSQRKMVFFFPDQHLGRNTCRKLGIAPDSMNVWDPAKILGGLTEKQIQHSRVLLWQGHCPVHMMFAPKQIDNLRAKDPEFKIIVHPECTAEVLDKADDSGSTEHIVKVVTQSPPGSKWGVGTEMHLVNRLAQENPDKTVVSINPFMCLCGTMNRIDLAHLAWALDCIREGRPENVITVGEPTRSLARATLDRMLALS